MTDHVTEIGELLNGFSGNIEPTEPEPTTRPAFEGTEDQNKALDDIMTWAIASDRSAPQMACLLGLAGTGKTTVATELIERIRHGAGLSTAVCAPTGKAASVLRRKGCLDASTLHRAIYKLDEEASETQGKLVWERRMNSRQASLVIVDEASMITEDQIADLKVVFGRILLVGDPGQLPPVSGKPALALPMPKHVLHKIHRQAEESGIVRFAHAIRAGESPSKALKVGGKDVVKGLAPEGVEVGVSLAAKNKTRCSANQHARYMRGFSGPVPREGELLMCLRNRSEDGWVNGMTCAVTEVTYNKGSDYCHIVAACDDGETRESRIWLECLDSEAMPRFDDIPRGLAPFWYAYAVTTHKAQGSEWPVIEVLENWPVWGKTADERQSAEDTARRWAYTASTRAKNTLYWGG